MRLSLRWYRDQLRGQEAADAVNANQEVDGTWSVAVLPCLTSQEADAAWRRLLADFGVNAMTHHNL